jgi:hypothetical protein
VTVDAQDPGVTIVGSADVGPDDLRWEKRLRELEFESLAKVRTAAEKWGATLTAILGLTGSVLVVKGAEDVTKLSSGNKLLVALALLAAFVFALAAAVLAALAAQGTPKELHWPSGPALRSWERNEALKAKMQLRESRGATVIAVLCMVAAIGVAWFGEGAASSPSTVLFTPANGKPLCGGLVNGDSGLELEVGDKTTALPAGSYENVVPVGSCPAKEPDE